MNDDSQPNDRALDILYEIFGDLPRQGPGDEGSTRRAFAMLKGLPDRPEILDVGCGSGAQTMVLASLCRGRITATDVFPQFIEVVRRKAEAAGAGGRIVPVQMSMMELDFPRESFDVIWSEGAIFIMGFREGLTAWRPLLKRGGYLVVSEAAWFVEDPPAEAQAFWNACYPAITDVASNVRTAEEAGYEVVGTFHLPAQSWWTDFYLALEPKLRAMRRTKADDADVLAEIAICQREIDIFRKYSDVYGYEFFILRKP
jgi:ubiquinone/menaquinone biosynthesis C-methylase UbiE